MDAAGSHSQVAQLTTAVVVLILLLVATPVIAWLPVAALASLVFLIGVKLIDVTSLRQIYQFRLVTFAVAVSALVAVVWLGVERGIFVAIALSVLDHLRQEYHPKDVVLTAPGGRWKPERAGRGVETAPGLVVYRFEAPLFFANADYFAARVRQVVTSAPHSVRWLVLDLVSTDDVDYTLHRSTVTEGDVGAATAVEPACKTPSRQDSTARGVALNSALNVICRAAADLGVHGQF